MVLLQPCVISLFGFAFALNDVGGQRQPAVHMKTDGEDVGERPCDIIIQTRRDALCCCTCVVSIE
jgi:hypothetical protein